MAATTDPRLTGRPLGALAATWLTTAGHTANFREMNAARGWITTEGYGLHSLFLFAIAVSLCLAPWVGRKLSALSVARLGLALLAAGSIIHGLDIHGSYAAFELARITAGVGAGMALWACPRLLAPEWREPAAWFGIVLPMVGQLVIGGAVVLSAPSAWEGGFLFEGVLALLGLALLVSIESAPDEPPPSVTATWLPAATVTLLTGWYLLHHGHLEGWFDSWRVRLTATAGMLAASLVLWQVWPRVDGAALSQAVPRLLVIIFAGGVQFYKISDLGIYGGLIINLGPFDRALLVVSLSIGAATGLVLGRLLWSRHGPGWGGATVGLLLIAIGAAWENRLFLGWPFWRELNVWEFNWFAAPQFWELAPPRFLIGLGCSGSLLAMQSLKHRDPAREAKIAPFLPAAQTAGGGLAVGLLATWLLIGHQWEYAYAADRGFIQADEVAARHAELARQLALAGAASPQRQSEVLMDRAVNYQADVLTFAASLAAIAGLAAVLAMLTVVTWVWERTAASHGPAVVSG